MSPDAGPAMKPKLGPAVQTPASPQTEYAQASDRDHKLQPCAFQDRKGSLGAPDKGRQFLLIGQVRSLLDNVPVSMKALHQALVKPLTGLFDEWVQSI